MPTVGFLPNHTKKGPIVTLTFYDKKETFTLKLPQNQGEWLAEMLDKITPKNPKIYTLQEVKGAYEAHGMADFELLWHSKSINTLRNFGLLEL